MIDFYIFQQINNLALRWDWLDKMGLFWAEYSGYLLLLALFSFVFFRFKKEKGLMIAKALSAAILARLVIVNIIRFFYNRPRPFVSHQVNLILDHEASGSFPSGHAAFFFALALIVYSFNKKLGVCFLLTSFLMGLARIFSGVHYPSDIAAGFLVAVFAGWVVELVSAKLKNPLRDFKGN